MQLHRQTYVPTTEEHQRIEQAILKGRRSWYLRHRDWTIFMLASMTGMRLNEALNLNISWINWESCTISIPAEINKMGRESIIWICPTLQKILKNYIKQHSQNFKSGHLFSPAHHNLTGAETCLSRVYWQRIWPMYLKRAGLLETKYIDTIGRQKQKVRFHTSTRTYFINQLFRANPNRNIFDLSRITRHKSVQCLYDHYMRFKDLDLWQDCLNNTFPDRKA